MSAFLTYAAVSVLASGIGKLMGNKRLPPKEVDDLSKKVMEPESIVLEQPQDDIQLSTEEEKVNDVRQGFEHLIATKKASLNSADETSFPVIQSDISILESLQNGLESVQKSQFETQKVIKDTSKKNLQGLSDIWKGIKALSAGVVGYGTAQAQKTIESSGAGPVSGAVGTVAALGYQLWNYLRNFLMDFGKNGMTDAFIDAGANPYEKLPVYTSEKSKEILEKKDLTEEDVFEANKFEYKERNSDVNIYEGIKAKDLTPNSEMQTFSLNEVKDLNDKKRNAKKFIEGHFNFFNHYTEEELKRLFNEGLFDQIIARIPDGKTVKEYKLSDIGLKIKESELKPNVVVEAVRQDSLEGPIDPSGKPIFENEPDILESANKFLSSLDIEPINEQEMFKNKSWFESPEHSIAELIIKRLSKIDKTLSDKLNIKELTQMVKDHDFSDILKVDQKKPEIESVGKTSEVPPVIYQDNSQHNTTPIMNMYGVRQTYGEPVMTPEGQTILSS